MSIQLYVIGLSISLVVGLIALSGILINIDPFQANIFSKALFFVCLFLILTSFLSLVGFFLKKKPKILFKRASLAFWQATLIAGLTILGLLIWKLKRLI